MRRQRTPLRRGQAMVEFALIMPMFLALFFGIIEIAIVSASESFCQVNTNSAANMIATAGATDATIDQEAITQLVTNLHRFVTIQIDAIHIEQLNSAGSVLATNAFDGLGNALGTPGWAVAGRVSSSTLPLIVRVRLDITYRWLTSFIGATGATLNLQISSVALATMTGVAAP